MRSALLLSLLLSGCVDARDVFAPYRPDSTEVEALVARPRQAHYDAALVLGCPAQADGSPSLCERCRVKSAVRLYKRGVVGKLVFSGGAAHSPFVEADVMADLAVSRGVPVAAILREGRALTTWQNVRFAKYLLEDNHLATTLVVSTADHLPRARRIALFYGLADERTGYFACDRDPPPDSEQEWQPHTAVVPSEED
ncbi:MAG: YdcF family protein [Polyangia bacterium]